MKKLLLSISGEWTNLIPEVSSYPSPCNDFRLMTHCLSFLHEKELIQPNENFFSATPISDAPLCVIAWIMAE